jgi:hypothetical protein
LTIFTPQTGQICSWGLVMGSCSRQQATGNRQQQDKPFAVWISDSLDVPIALAVAITDINAIF